MPYRENIIHVDVNNPIGCRLCALFISRFRPDQPYSEPFEVEYWLDMRQNYFMSVHDIVFRPVRSTSFGVVRLALQEEKATRTNNPPI